MKKIKIELKDIKTLILASIFMYKKVDDHDLDVISMTDSQERKKVRDMLIWNAERFLASRETGIIEIECSDTDILIMRLFLNQIEVQDHSIVDTDKDSKNNLMRYLKNNMN